MVGVQIGKWISACAESCATLFTMATVKEKLIEELLDLDDAERAELAGLLIESLDIEVEKGVEAAWLQEIERRMESLDSGKVETVSWGEVRERLYSNMNV